MKILLNFEDKYDQGFKRISCMTNHKTANFQTLVSSEPLTRFCSN